MEMENRKYGKYLWKIWNMEYGAGTAGNHSGEEHRYQGSSEAWFLGRKHSRSNNVTFFPKPMRMCGKRLERRPKPWIKKTFGSSSQNRYTSRFVRRRRHRLTDLVHFRFVQPFWLVVHFTDLCNSKKSWT